MISVVHFIFIFLILCYNNSVLICGIIIKLLIYLYNDVRFIIIMLRCYNIWIFNI